MFKKVAAPDNERFEFFTASVGIFLRHFRAAQAQFVRDFFIGEREFVQREHFFAMVADCLQNADNQLFSFVLQGDAFRVFGFRQVVIGRERHWPDTALPIEPPLLGDAEEVGLQAAAAPKPPLAQVAVEQNERFLKHVLPRRLITSFAGNVAQHPLSPARLPVEIGKRFLPLLYGAEQCSGDLLIGTSGRIFQ